MTPGAQPVQTSPLKLALTGLAGASVETYDFTIYATASALVFPSEFFPPSMSPLLAQIASFSAFGVGFLTRPLGAALFGHLGDRIGRSRTFALSLNLMGTATLAIALLPTYRTWGAFAPLTLVALRLIQGLAMGGQWGGSILIATESAPAGQRGFYGSIAQAAPSVAVILANLVFLVVSAGLSARQFLAWGWRIPFGLGLGVIALGLYVRFRLPETADFSRVQRAAKDRASPAAGARSPVIQALAKCPITILKAAGTFMVCNLTFYILNIYVLAWGTSRAGLHLSQTYMLTAVLLATPAAATMFLAGAWSDRFGRRPVMIAGVLSMLIYPFILFQVLQTRSWLLITMGIAVGNAVMNVVYGPMAALFSELFDARVRYSAVSLSYQIGILAGGAWAPIIATALYAHYRSSMAVAAYMSIACALSLVCLMTLKEARRAIPVQAAADAPIP